MVESNRSASPCREQMLISETHSESLSAKEVSAFSPFRDSFSGEAIRKAALLNLGAHLLHRTVRVQEFAGKIDDFSPFQCMTMRPVSVTRATTVASRFSPFASARNFSQSAAATTTAMRS